MGDKKYIYFVLAILFLTLSLRIIYLVQTKDNPLFLPVDNGLDSSLYHQRAQLLTQGVGFSPDFVYGMPFYPYFLATIYLFFKENILAVRLIQMLLGIFSCLLIYFITREVFNLRCALISLFLCAFYGMFIFYEGMLLGTSLTILFNCLMLCLLLFMQRRFNYWKWSLLGLLVGVSSLNQANILTFVPFMCIWLIFTSPEKLKKKLLGMLIFCVTLVLVITPVTLRNYFIAKDFIPITAHGGINFYIGNNPQSDGSFKPPAGMHISVEGLIADSIMQAQRHTGRQMQPSEVSQFWFKQGIHFIQTQPLTYLKLLGRKFALLLNSYEIFDVEDYSFFRRQFPTVLNLPLPSLKLILPLGLLGIVLSLRAEKQRLLLYLFMASYIISVVAYFVNARYRLPLVPFLIIFAGYTFDWWLMNLKHKNLLAIFLSLVGLAILFFATNLRLVHQDYTSQYNNLGVAYKELGKFDLAIDAYKKALEINPALAQTHSNLGNLYNATGEYAKAIQEFKQAIALEPNLAEAHSNLAIVYMKQGRIDEAISEYQKAVQLRPNLITAHYNLGVIYQKKRQWELAREEFTQTVKFAPEHAEAHNNLGAVYNAQEKLKLAKEEFKKAIALKKDFLEAHFNLGLVYFQQKLFSSAKAQWQKVLEINPQFLPAQENLNKLEQLGY